MIIKRKQPKAEKEEKARVIKVKEAKKRAPKQKRPKTTAVKVINIRKVEARPFDTYHSSLPPQEAAALEQFFSSLERHMALSRQANAAMREDFEQALLHYAEAGVALGDALERLAVHNMGGFYVRPPVLWFALDDAAKVYPLSMRQGQMSVFRLSVYLKEQVVPELLQIALTFTIKRFPSFATTVKRGFFWHYLDTAKRRYATRPETEIPCRPLKISKSGSQSFRVLYFNNRISVEYFHILTDGTGGMVFLKTLVAQYLRLCGVQIPACAEILDINAPPEDSELANEFSRSQTTNKGSGFVDKAATQMGGKISKIKPCQLIHFKMDANQLIAAAKSKGTTVTAYLLACMFVAGKYATDETDGSINIQVPVNMRKFYPCATVRNFAMYCGIRLPIEGITGVDDILGEISSQLAAKASKESMGEMMNSTKRMVTALKYIPLFVKAPVAGIVYGFLGDRIFSNTLSNLGVVKLPAQMEEHIESMDFVLGTGISNRASCGMVTTNNIATLSISKLTADPSFEEKLYDLLVADGINPVVEGSALYED